MLTFMSILMLAAVAPPTEPAPERTAGIALVEGNVRAQMRDPDSAKFTWPHGFTFGTYKRAFHGRASGWITCGTVNAKNGYGGYTGPKTVIAVVSGNAVALTDIDDNENFGSNHGPPTEACRKLGMPTF